MFPLSEDSLIALVLAGWYLLNAGVFYLAMRRSLRLAAMLCVASSVLVLLVVLVVGGGSILIYTDALIKSLLGYPLGAVMMAFVTAVAVRGRVVQSWCPGALVPVLLALPALAGMAYVLERQTLPNHACATSHIPVQVGQVMFRLPLAMHGDIFRAVHETDVVQYRPLRRTREDVRSACRLTNKGETTLDTSILWLSAINYLPDLAQRCAGRSAGMCQGFSRQRHDQIGALKIMRVEEQGLRYERSLFAGPVKPEELRAGDLKNGHICQTGTGSELTHHCRMWRTLSPQTELLITTQHVGNTTQADLVAVLRQELDYILRVLAAPAQ
ncbi:MAG: hypothetical protein AB8B82_16805 [Roseovarius sp.]